MTITAFQLKSKHFKPKLAESDITTQTSDITIQTSDIFRAVGRSWLWDYFWASRPNVSGKLFFNLFVFLYEIM